MKLQIPTKKQIKDMGTKTCSECFETKGIYTLKELRDADDTPPSAKMQAMLLLQEHGYKESDKFCEDCFWK